MQKTEIPIFHVRIPLLVIACGICLATYREEKQTGLLLRSANNEVLFSMHSVFNIHICLLPSDILSDRFLLVPLDSTTIVVNTSAL